MKNIEQGDKLEINALFEQADLKIGCLLQQLIESFDSETKIIRTEIKDQYMEYWKLTTCAEMMSIDFKTINENYYRRHNESFIKFETKIKQAINKVHRL